MKQNLFKLMMLVGLIALANTTFAQAETSPVVGASYEYTVSNLTPTNGYVFSLSTSSATTNAGTVSASTATMTGNVLGSGSTSTATITWNTTDNSFLWITVTGTSSSSCTNMRYLPITPIPNNFDATVIAIGTSTNTEYPSWGSAGEDNFDCHVYVNADLSSTGNDDGDSYVFFVASSVTQTKGSNTWNLSSVSISGQTAEYWVASTWTTTAPSNLAYATKVLVRATVDNVPAGTSMTATITATENEGTGTLADNVSGNNTSGFTVESYPDLGTATFN